VVPLADRDPDHGNAAEEVQAAAGSAAETTDGVMRRAGSLRRRRGRFRAQRAILALTATLVLAFAVGAVLVLQRSHLQSIDNAEALLESKARAAEIAADRFLAAIDTVLLGVAGALETQLPVAAGEISADNLMHRFQADGLAISDIIMLDAAGRRLNGPGGDANAGLFAALRAHGKTGLLIAAAEPSGTSGDRRLTIGRPVWHDGELVGAVAATVDTTPFSDFFRAIAAKDGTQLSLLRDNGVLIAGEPAGDRTLGGGANLAPDLLAILGQRPALFFDATADNRLWALRRLSGQPLIVSVSRDRRDVLGRWFDQCATVLLAFVLFAATAGMLGWLGVRAVGRHQLAVAHLRRSEARLRRQTALLQSTLENIGEGLSVFNRRGRLMAWNARFCTLLDLPAQGIQGATLREILTLQAQRGDFGAKPVEAEVAYRLGVFYLSLIHI